MANHENDINALKGDIDSLKADLKTLSESIRHQAQSQARAGYAKAREASDKVRHQAQHGIEYAGDQIEERPLISVLTAFGVGFLIGKLLDRR
jgi:ElaB/YqjD/DUF883 family membrane-anchored ribosome-binding protein